MKYWHRRVGRVVFLGGAKKKQKGKKIFHIRKSSWKNLKTKNSWGGVEAVSPLRLKTPYTSCTALELIGTGTCTARKTR